MSEFGEMIAAKLRKAGYAAWVREGGSSYEGTNYVTQGDNARADRAQGEDYEAARIWVADYEVYEDLMAMKEKMHEDAHHTPVHGLPIIVPTQEQREQFFTD